MNELDAFAWLADFLRWLDKNRDELRDPRMAIRHFHEYLDRQEKNVDS